MIKAFVYFNLHKHCWSIKALNGSCKGRVIQHASYVQLKNAVTSVSEAGRQRVLREQCKNVHAGIRGELIDSVEIGEPCPTVVEEGLTFITYNPYRDQSFVEWTDTKQTVCGRLSRVFMLPDRRVGVVLS